MIKKGLACLLAVLLLVSMIPCAHAVDDSRTFFFELSVDGKDSKEVQNGDVITVTFTLNRTDSGEDYDMYAMQNEIRYDSGFFELVEGSAMLSNGIASSDIGLRDSFREFYMNFVSLTGGEKWSAKRLVGSFQLRVIGQSGVTKITNQDYLVSTADGKDSFKAECQDVTIILSTECKVTYQTNGGSEIPAQMAQYGEILTKPEDPIREGYHLEGWYTDIDLQKEWNFETDTVQGNMTLYAKWAEGDPIGASGGLGGLWWVLILLLLLLVLLLLAFLLGRKTVKFVTGCETEIEDQKVWKGKNVQRPAQPRRVGRMFAGWYTDEACTNRWDFEVDTVSDHMTLYAKWL